MEVHAHTHTERKKFTHYLWEFLMLFLAVFCGFMAENFREHIVEHQQEKKYMVTLLEDLHIDIADMEKLKKNLAAVMARKDSAEKYLRPPISTESTPQYYKEAWLITSIVTYNYNDRTVDQLRSSGSYRLIRSKSVTDSLIDYDTRMRGGFTKNYNVLFESQLKLIDLQNDILDVGVAIKYLDENANLEIDSLKANKLWPLHLLTTDPKILFRHYNLCMTHTAFIINLQNWIKIMITKATNLMSLIKKEYHLK